MTEKEIRGLVVSTAQKYLGYKESNGTHKKIIDIYNGHKPLAQGYKVKYTDAWCATFVSFVGIQCGLTDIILTECSCPRMIELYKKKGRWKEDDNYKPAAGDIVMYDWQDSGVGDNTGTPDHVGIVVSVSGNSIKIIEGNIDNAVGYRNIAVNGKYIRGYCLPDYAKKSTNATSGSNSSSTSKPTATKKTVAEVAKEVVAGKWGNGAARTSTLKKAGYDPDAVQKAVNSLLSGKPTKTVDDIAREVISGKWGNGAKRTAALQRAGYDPVAVQKRVNQLLR